MILFIVKKPNASEFQSPDPEGYYNIPINYVENDINAGNIQLVSWNEVRYKSESGPEKEIKTVKDLFEVVLEVAETDPVCQDMNEQFKLLYKAKDSTEDDIDIFKNFKRFIDNYNPNENIPDDDTRHIFITVYECWPHPMIGNVALSPECRPQSFMEQYFRNFLVLKNNYNNNKYMSEATTTKIRSMLLNSEITEFTTEEGLRNLTKSNRDQCRMCKDWTELARAVIGEISSYVSRMLEKIYALELCNSSIFLEEQKKLLEEIVTFKGYKTLLGESLSFEEIFKCFNEPDKERTLWGYIEYIYRYFKSDWDKIETPKSRWYAFASFINTIETNLIKDINISDVSPNDQSCINNIINKSNKIPPVIRCAMVFNAVRKFSYIPVSYLEQSINLCYHSIKLDEETNKKFLDRKCSLDDAESHSFIPLIEVNGSLIRLSSWMRDEYHPTTIAKRHFLMPLWAGPSGHANTLLRNFNYIFNKENDEKEYIRLANILLPSIFSFWRLYYDKRISGNHTLAESFEAAFYTESCTSETFKGNRNQENLAQELEQFNKINNLLSKHESTLKSYDEVYETLTKITYTDDSSKNIIDVDINGIYSSIGILYRIYKKRYTEKNLSKNIIKLKQAIQNLEKQLVKKEYDIIKWSKDIIYTKKINEAQAFCTNIAICNASIDGFNKIDFPETDTLQHKIASHCINEIDTFCKMEVSPSTILYSPRLQYIHNRLTTTQANQKTFERNEEFNINPPPCLTDKGIVDFVGGMVFNDISISQPTSNSEINYKAIVNTQSDCWNRLKIFGLQDNQPIECIVSENNNSLMFQGKIQLDGSFPIGSISLSLKQLIIGSSLDSDYISCRLEASIEANNKTLAVTLYLPLYSGTIDVYGEYENGNVFTITDLLTIFGLNNVIDPTKILPASEEIFGNLGLQSLHLNLSDSFQINQIGFVITTEKPWSIIENKISITPVFEIDIDNPFDTTNRNIYCTTTGKWFLGEGENTTEFDVTLTSELTIYAGLAQGSVLQFETFTALFGIKNTIFPSRKFTDLSLMADFKSSNYSFSVAAEDVYSFKVGKAELGIEGVSCSLDFLNGSFGELSLSGSFKLGEMELNVYGSYKGDNSFTFNADAFSDLDYSLGKFITDISGDLLYNGGTSSFPDEYLTVNIRSLNVSYNSTDHNFIGDIDLDHVLEISSDFAINDIKFHISSSDKSPLEFLIQAHLLVLETQMTLTLEKNSLGYRFYGKADFIDASGNPTASVKNILDSFKIDTTSIPDFICNFYVRNISACFEIQEDKNSANSKKIITLGISTSAGDLTVSVTFGNNVEWSILYKNSGSVNVLEMPVVGELVNTVAPNTTDLTISNFEVDASSEKGVFLRCNAFGSPCEIQIYKPDPQPAPKQNYRQNVLMQSVGSSGPAFDGTVVWKKFEPPKTIFILSLPKIGLGMDDGHIAVLLDASLNISPLTLSLNEAGIGVALSEPIAYKFYLSGFGVSFDNGVLSIGGGLSIGKDEDGNQQYSGLLSIRFKEIGLTAIGQYTKIIEQDKETAAICACFSLLAPIGGIPAFFVKGLAGGFGYNERLILPSIEKVNDYFLIKAAMDGFGKDPNPKKILDKQVKAENGQYFLAAGLKFTTFETIEGCVLVTVSFGNDFELGLLGLANLSIPPKVPTNPIAYAELAIKASVKPLDGVFSVEAQLTNESYILSKKCKLTGGFAAYAWFGDNEHSGDFVVTLGGYHPSYQRPAHYPTVPRLGLNWQVDSHTNINGEIYFAMTPAALMAGGKLSITYTLGDLKAWFIAYADILMKWKPFAYDISIGVLVGASYTMSLFGIRKTFSIELGADLKLWGPEVQAKVHISWFIISFTISFSEGADHSKDSLDWEGFKSTFLVSPKENDNLKQSVQNAPLKDSDDQERSDILSISLQGVIGKTSDGTDIVSAHQLCISAFSKIPENNENGQAIHVRPAGKNCNISNSVMKVVVENDSITEKFKCEKIMQNVPAALWGEETSNNLNGEGLVKDQSCGKKLSIQSSAIDLFPKNQFIRLSELYKDNIIHCWNSFVFSKDASWNLKDGDETIEIFKANEITSVTSTTENRKAFLTTHGLSDKDVEDISLTEFATNADDLLSESILIINV